MTARKRKSIDAALRALFEQRMHQSASAPLAEFARQLAAANR
jgi:hypothetical protein